MIDRDTGEIVSFHRRSESCAAIFAALAKAQETFGSAERAAENPAFKRGNKTSTYATLESVLEASKAGRAANGLAVVQMPGNVGNNIAVTTILGHSSGEWIEATVYVAPAQFNAQATGSVITYLRRYSLMAILGIAPEDDDDGNAAVAPPNRSRAPTAATKANPATAEASPERDAAREAYRRLQRAIDSAPDDATLRMVYDAVLEEWGDWALDDVELVTRIAPGSIEELKRRIAGKMSKREREPADYLGA